MSTAFLIGIILVGIAAIAFGIDFGILWAACEAGVGGYDDKWKTKSLEKAHYTFCIMSIAAMAIGLLLIAFCS